MREQVDRRAADIAATGTTFRCSSTDQRLLHSERQQHDAGHHREVEVGERVTRDLVLLAADLRPRQPALGDQRDDVEVRPPERARHDDAEHRRRHDAGVHVAVRPHADRHDRLAQRDDDDQPVALGEVARGQLPALRAEQVGLEHVEREGEGPDGGLDGVVGEQRADDQQAAPIAVPPARPRWIAGARLVAAGEQQQRDLAEAHPRVGAGEQHARVAERLGDAEGDHQQRAMAANIANRTAPSSGLTVLASQA